MKTIIKLFLCLTLCISIVTITSCSKDDIPVELPDNPNSPSNPGADDKPNPLEQIKGTWKQSSTSFGITSDIKSTSSFEFGTSNSLKVSWTEEGEETPYTVANGIYSIKDDVMTVKWTSVTTDGVANTAFTSIYLEGGFTVSETSLTYNYSVYEGDGTKLSGPHSLVFVK